MKKETIIKITKYLLDFMFFAGIVVTLTLPFSVKWIGEHASQLSILGKIQEHLRNVSSFILYWAYWQ